MPADWQWPKNKKIMRRLSVNLFRFFPIVALALAGCATTGTTTGNVDPDTGVDQLESMNRTLFAIHKSYDRYLLRPVATGYQTIVPGPFRRAITNFFLNFRSPVYIVNDLLQGKPKHALQSTSRMVINSTLGLGGIWDPAEMSAGLPKRQEDFGQTLAVWGVNSGPYSFIPFLGPSTTRDGIGILIDALTMGPILAISDSSLRWKALGLFYINTRADLLPLDEMLETAADPYVFLREAFLQRRNYVIHDGDPPEEDFEDFGDEDD